MRQLIGRTLIGVGIFGLLLSAAGLVAVWWGVARAGAAIERQLSALDGALQTTGAGLDVAGGAIGDSRQTLAALAATLGGATQTITDTMPALDDLRGLAGGELPQTIRSTQTALGSAQETAQVIDRVLGTISGFGLLSSATYNPEVPLGESIGQVSASLDDLPASLQAVSAGMGRATTSLGQLNRDLAAAARGLDEVRTNLADAAKVVGQYKGIVADLRSQVADVRAAAPGWLRAAGLGLSLLLIWMAAAQLALFSQGGALLRK